MKHYLALLLAPIGGLLYTAGFPSPFKIEFPLLSILGTTLFLISIFQVLRSDRPTLLRILLRYLAFSSICALFGHYWIAISIHKLSSLPWIVCSIFNLIFCFVATPQYLVASILLFLFYKYDFNKQLKNPIFSINVKIVLLATALTIIEQLTPQMFPSYLGHPWIVLAPYMGLASIFGVSIYSFIGFYVAISTVNLYFKKNNYIFPVLVTSAFLLTNFLIPLPNQKNKSLTTKVRVVQTNIGSYTDINDGEMGNYRALEYIITKYYEQSTNDLPEKTQLIVWPETSLPVDLSLKELKENYYKLPTIVGNITTQTNAELLFGGNMQEGEAVYNTTFLSDTDGQLKMSYQKHILIPFGEYLPLRSAKQIWDKYLYEIPNTESGHKFTLFKLANQATFITPICYEIIFTNFVRTYLLALKSYPHFIINPTNDYWYGDTHEPEQHLMLSRWRSVEFSLPIIRSAKTGISALINSDGTIAEYIGLFKSDVSDLEIKTPSRTTPTIYYQYGHLPFFLIVLFLFMISFIIDRHILRRF